MPLSENGNCSIDKFLADSLSHSPDFKRQQQDLRTQEDERLVSSTWNIGQLRFINTISSCLFWWAVILVQNKKTYWNTRTHW